MWGSVLSRKCEEKGAIAIYTTNSRRVVAVGRDGGFETLVTARLIVIVFPTENRANDVFRALGAMRHRELYNLDEVLLAARSRAGMVTVSTLGSGSRSETEHPIETIANLILAQADAGKTGDRDSQNMIIDPHFVTAVASKMDDEFSALFFLIRDRPVGVAAELSNVLSLFRGQIAHTTLATDVRASHERS